MAATPQIAERTPGAAPSAELRLDQLVLARNLISAETLARALLVQSETGEPLDTVLTRLGLLSEAVLASAIADSAGLSIAASTDFPAEPLAAARLSPRFLREARAIPLREAPSFVEVALVDPLSTDTIEALTFAFRRPIVPLVARASDMDVALDRLYPDERELESEAGGADEADVERLKDLSSDAPVVRAVNALISRAVEAQASDIHIEPAEDSLKIRLRIDGALQDEDPLPPHLKAAFVSRIKVMSGLNIAERRLPQDGRLRLAVRGHEIDLRVASAPTIHGESVVMRILDRSNLPLDFESLGFDEATLARFLKVLRLPHGIVLVTGPTGSGKTTTLYASLAAMNTSDRKILTIEDPIEYRLAGIGQTQVNSPIGLTFANALRSFLRQDPDIMMVGEIRDLETAQVAVQAALTGHTILSTLHTNSAAAAVTRLLDMGVEPFLITSTLNAVLAQRLVRRLCPHCREGYAPTPETFVAVGISPAGIDRLWRPVGCARCGGTGFRGRIALLELLVSDAETERLILARAEAREIQAAAKLRTMLEDGLAKAAAGLTTLDEVLRVTQES
ncbi:MAG: Flp pilus assembly complex ATPase component TadA [Caulobacteraceae bacterium]|nr:Flp pilus assembly complex ATPase component TadA [Caulobacteraceae bacterium]